MKIVKTVIPECLNRESSRFFINSRPGRNNNRKAIPAPFDVYNKLYKRFGPQGWWPVTLDGELSPRYYPLSYPKLTLKEKFEIAVGAVLTQNTAWTNVEKALYNLHKAGMLSPRQFIESDSASISELIRPAGYYNQKTGYLKNLSLYFEKLDGSLSPSRDELLSIKGIGHETADSILLYAFNIKTFVIDAYTMRLAERAGWLKEKKYSRAQDYFENNLPRSVEVYKEFHALIVQLCKEHCRRKPTCHRCPLAGECTQR